MTSEIKGIVLKSKPFGNTDKLLTVFTAEEGKITVLAKNVRASKKSVLYTQPFAYSDFILFRTGGIYTVDQANIIDAFYGLSNDILSLSAGQYFLELADQLPSQMTSGEESFLLRLLLNSLFLLSGSADASSIKKIKLMFELKFASSTGFEPDLTKCVGCGTSAPAFWFYGEGMKCEKCGADKPGGHRITDTMVKAITYITKSDMSSAYKFDMPNESLDYIAMITENYIKTIFDSDFSSLNYYKQLSEFSQ